jgi:hypothetical protein
MARVDFKDMVSFTEVVMERQKLFDGFELEMLEEYEGMDTSPARDFKTPMANGFYNSYTIKGMNKVEKIAIGELNYMRRAKYCAMNMTASDDYDLPIFACEFDEFATRVGITLDLMPLVNIVCHPEYRRKYLDPLNDIWREFRALNGLTREGRCLVQRRYGSWPWARASLSPYPLDGNIEEAENRYKILEAVNAYARIWLKMLEKAEPIKDPEYKQEMLKRKKTLQYYYRERDPGGEVLKKIFGKERHRLFINLIF